jgi:predicted dienelactone hydrolase
VRRTPNKQCLAVHWAAWSSLALAAAAISAWLVLFPTPRFPKPTGSYDIGTRIFPAWTDAARAEPFTPDPGDRRQLVVQIWYPTHDDSGPRQRYIERSETLAALAPRFHVPAWLLRNIEHAPTHSVSNAAIAAGRFAVLLNPTGFSGFRDASLFWIEELASHGYVVVGFDQPGTAAATALDDGRVIPVMDTSEFHRYMPLALSQTSDQAPTLNGVVLPGGIIPFLAEDLRFVLDQLERLDREDPVLAGHLDLQRAGVFGMSLGGYVGPEACHLDRRLLACLAVDAGQTATVVRDGLQQPVMIMSRDAKVIREERAKAGGWPEPDIEHTIHDERALFERNRGDAYYVTMNGMYHVNWTDAPILTPIIRWIGLAGPIDPYLGFSQTNAYTVAFFDLYLKNRASPLLDEGVPTPTDVRLEVRRVRRRD